MDRRRFFKLAAAALGALPGLGQAANSLAPRRRLLLQESPLAGFQYHQGEALWPRLRVGQPLALVREPGNRFDRRAVRIEWRGSGLGYLPRVENAAVAQMLDRGERLEARIVALAEGSDPWKRVRVAVEVVV